MINDKITPLYDRPNMGKSDPATIRGLILIIASSFIAFPGYSATQPITFGTTNPFMIQDQFSYPLDKVDDSKLIEEFDPAKLEQNQIRSLISQGVNDLRNNKKQEGLDKLKQAWAMNPSIPIAGVIIASTYLQTKDYSAALEIAQKIQKNSPRTSEGYTLAGITYAGLDDQKQAQTSFEKALEVKPGDPEAARNLATLYLKQDNADKARNVLTDALSHNPDHLQTINALAELEFKTNQRQKAVSLLESAITKYPNEIPPRILLAQLHLASNQRSEAFTILGETIKQFPNNPDLLEFVAVTQLENGAPDKSLPLLESAVKVSPNNITLHYNLALVHEQLKHYPQAMAEIDKALKLDPNHASSKFVRAKLLASTGQLEAAQKLLKELEESNPESVNIPELRGRIAIGLKKPDEAIGYFKSAVKKQEENPLLIIYLAMAQMEAKNIDAGYDTLRLWIEKHPNDISVRIILADILLDKGHHDEAQKYYAEVLKLQPDKIEAGNNLAWLLAESGELDKAVDLAEKTHVLAPENPWVMDTLAMILLKKDQTNKATDLLRKAVTILPDNPTMSYHLAQTLIGSKKDEAKTILKSLLSNKKTFKERELTKELLKKLESE